MSRRLYVSLAIVAAIVLQRDAQQPPDPGASGWSRRRRRASHGPRSSSARMAADSGQRRASGTQQSIANPSLGTQVYGTTAKEIS